MNRLCLETLKAILQVKCNFSNTCEEFCNKNITILLQKHKCHRCASAFSEVIQMGIEQYVPFKRVTRKLDSKSWFNNVIKLWNAQRGLFLKPLFWSPQMFEFIWLIILYICGKINLQIFVFKYFVYLILKNICLKVKFYLIILF